MAISYEQQWGKIMTGPEVGTESKWSALVLAGSRPAGDPLAEHFGAKAKALIDFAGKPMLAHVVATLNATPEIGRVVVIAQQTAPLEAAVAQGGGAALRTSGGGISTSIAALAGSDALPFPILVTTADHPLLLPSMIGEFLNGAGDADVAVGMVERATMLARYPENRRTWLKFSDGHWSGANLFALAKRTLPACARALGARRAGSQDGVEAVPAFRSVAGTAGIDPDYWARRCLAACRDAAGAEGKAGAAVSGRGGD